ncbi:phosphotransferase [Sutcliffiella deserti]|uniref:phosphotransferase n=1 Tax=Sutcliffiella deserti TaxID=2875501 RepID=UPI001CBE5EAD|nr:phosphotransferase [Sutcliffiella deserti]
MDIQKIIKELINNNIIPSEPDYEQLKGGTNSELYLLKSNGLKCVVKLNEPQVIESEAIFLNTYKDINLLPKLLFVEPSFHAMVYSFINGSTDYVAINKKEMLRILVEELLNKYKDAPSAVGWGWPEDPVESWQHFLMNEVVETNRILASRLDKGDYEYICNLVLKNNTDSKHFLLHGDCGVHNFIFDKGQFCGVIDSTPVIGDPMYDLTYAFCSSPDDLTKDTIDSGAKNMRIYREGDCSDLYEQVVISLYLRLGACIKHHPKDFEKYLKAWNYWKGLVKNR